MKRMVVWISFLIAVTSLAPGAQFTKAGLTRLLEAELDRFPARAGVYVKHLPTGEEAGVRADEAFSSASVIKIPIMVRAFQLAEEKKLDLRTAYVDSVRVIFIVLCALSAVALVSSLFIKSYDLNRALETEQGFVEVKKSKEGFQGPTVWSLP